MVFAFFVGYTPAGVQMMTDIDKYLSFVLWMFVAFGVTFEIPVVLVVLVRLGVVTLDKLKPFRRYVIVGAFVVAAVITPPDVVSQLMLAVPMCLLYELGIVRSRASSRSRRTMTLKRTARRQGPETRDGWLVAGG